MYIVYCCINNIFDFHIISIYIYVNVFKLEKYNHASHLSLWCQRQQKPLLELYPTRVRRPADVS